MKKLLTIALLVLFTSTVKAQTKEETITWLKEKLEKCLKGYAQRADDIKLISINECEFVVSYKMDGAEYEDTVPTVNIDISLTDGNISFKSKVIKKAYSNTDRKWYSGLLWLSIDDREDNVRARMLKAFQHLATFCPPKKAETF